MGFHPILIKKSCNELKKSLLDILHSELPTTAVQIKRRWINYLEMIVESVGWQAFWKIPRKSCAIYSIPFPTTVVVMLDGVNFESLSANVTVTDVEDNINLPESFTDVSLLNLFPTVEQENNYIDIKNIADALYDFRFFFNSLWYPWDEHENENWVDNHLENRLKLSFELTSGNISHQISQKIRDLILEGHHIFDKIKELDLEMNQDDQISEFDVRVLTSGPLYLKLEYISQQLTFYENEKLWKLTHEVMEDDISPPCTALVWLGGTPADFLSVMNKVHKTLPPGNNMFKSFDSLQKLLKEARSRDRVLLSAGLHYLKNLNVLPFNGGILQGIENNPENVKIVDSEEGLCLFDIVNKECFISNVELVGSNVKFIFVVRFGRCHLANVKINGSHKTIGVFIHPGAELYADNCHFYGCHVAVHCEKSSVVLKNCTFQENKSCIEYEDGQVSLDLCEFIKNENGIVERTSIINKTDSFSLMKEKQCSVVTDLDGLKVKNVTFKGNKCDFRKEN